MEENEVMQESTADEFLEVFSEESAEEVEEPTEEESTEETSEETEEETEETEEETVTEEPAKEEERYTVKINGEDKTFSLDELKAEAGRSIARQEKLEKVQANTDRLAEIARRHNMSVADLITQAEQSLTAVQFENIRQSYIDKGYDEEVAEELANKDIEIERAKNENKVPEPTEEDVARQKDIEKFNSLYPDITIDDIPNEVFEDIANKGLTLVEAYQRHELNKAKAEAEAIKQQKENEKKAVGSARSKQAKQTDAFLSEFNRW